MTESKDWPEFLDDDDLPKYSQYMTRDEALAVLEAHVDPLRPFADHPDPELSAIIAARIKAAESAFKRLDGFYKIGALPRYPDLPDNAVDEIRARNKAKMPPKPSLWSRLTGKS